MFAAKDTLLTRPSGAYHISRSVRLRSSASAYLNRTPASAGNRKTWTWSGWVKRGRLSVTNYLFSAPSTSSSSIFFSGVDRFHVTGASGAQFNLETTSVYRDISAWYHIVVAFDTTQATSTNRLKVYINGNQVTAFASITYPSLNLDGEINNNIFHQIGRPDANTHDGYLTEINFIDGQALTPSSFGETNSITGVWQPKAYSGTYGTNGFYLNFSDNSGATATTIGKDNSGNGNNWTPNNISVTAGVTYDSMLDVPTPYADGGNGRGNYAMLNPLNKDSSQTVSDGNLTYTGSASLYGKVNGSIGMSSGKWYWEATLTGGGGSLATTIGIATAQSPLNASPGDSGDAYGWGYYNFTGNKYNNGTSTAYGSTYTTNDVIGVAFDADAGTLTFYKNNTSQGTAFSSLTSGPYFPSVGDFGTTSYPIWAFNFGQRPFTYTPPTGFVALNTQNLPTPTISNGANYMAATLYTGNGTSQSISNAVNGVSFQPDMAWVKDRSAARSHVLIDAVRGTGLTLFPNETTADQSNTDRITSFNSNGFSVGTGLGVNASTETYVGWQWNAGGSTVTNTSGSISAQVRANATAGFSVVTWAGNTTSGATVGHGLGVKPAMIIFKRRDGATDWHTYHSALSNSANALLYLNTTATPGVSSAFLNGTQPTSSIITLGDSAGTNGSSMIAYCFAAVAGYSAFGSYTGNGSTDGPFVFTGFRPRFVMFKRTDTTGDWQMYDSSRDTYNVTSNTLYANGAFAEDSNTTNRALDLLSNGFKLRSSASFLNASGGTYIYMAFAENPLKLSLAR